MARSFTDDQFIKYTDKLEGGGANWMYLIYDPNGGFHVATGYGITFLSVDDALELPWFYQKAGGASKPQVEADYATIWAKTDLAGGPGKPHKMGGDPAWPPLTGCRLTPDGIKIGVLKIMERKLKVLRGNFPQYDDWPGSAQLAAISIQWAGDVKGGWPNLTKSCLVQNWEEASTRCSFAVTKDTNAYLALRSKYQVTLFKNAQRVKDGAAPVTHVDWETVLP